MDAVPMVDVAEWVFPVRASFATLSQSWLHCLIHLKRRAARLARNAHSARFAARG
jgi:hypothetical protein